MSTVVEQQVNLYQPIFRAERRLFSANTIGLALAAITVTLLGIWGFGYFKLARLDRELEALHRQEASRSALAEQIAAELRPHASLAEIEASNQQLASQLESRQQVLALVQQLAPASASAGFAEQLQALGRRQVEGVWLRRIVLAAGGGHLLLQGAASHPAAIPEYVQALADEPALAHVHFDEFQVERTDGKASADRVHDAVSFRLASADVARLALEKKP